MLADQIARQIYHASHITDASHALCLCKRRPHGSQCNGGGQGDERFGVESLLTG
jgi:hypothetical protein